MNWCLLVLENAGERWRTLGDTGSTNFLVFLLAQVFLQVCFFFINSSGVTTLQHGAAERESRGQKENRADGRAHRVQTRLDETNGGGRIGFRRRAWWGGGREEDMKSVGSRNTAEGVEEVSDKHTELSSVVLWC